MNTNRSTIVNPSAPRVVRKADALTFQGPGETLRFLIAGDDNTLDLMHGVVEPGGGPPLHSHPWASYDLVVGGRLLYRLGDDDIELKAGDFVYTPPNMPHTFMAVGGTAEVVGINVPGGFHSLYSTIERILGETDADPAALEQAVADHGGSVLGPPLAILTQGALA